MGVELAIVVVAAAVRRGRIAALRAGYGICKDVSERH